MMLDLLPDNTISINLKAIQIFGLNDAAYISLLFQIYKKAINKNKLIDNEYFKVDRKYIADTLSLLQEDQIICDLNLIKLGILKKHADNPDILKLDIQLYLSILSNEDFKLIEDIKKQMQVRKPRGVKLSQRQQTINALKDSIECSNYELLTALRNWVDGVYANPTGFLSKTAVNVFQDTLYNYTKGDVDLALRIVQIATIQGYRDCQWAINLYEKDKNRVKATQVKQIRTTTQISSSKDTLSDIVF